ncbi:hypothetical protein VN97_g10582 [Penicillium thymicola]|uniref:Uncharacterized protein n=1 Tax=Penicillium thymicola TaxID=293382 RepID=A0AAI9TA89_PENTH|nr:hypothetical protein VN97_g10582 [Penicillium thymicola]
MPLSDRDLHFSPIPRSREENQERYVNSTASKKSPLTVLQSFYRCFTAKRRSLVARLESANRASSLHKHRTGKAFHITKEIVEKEGMYEEVDERYQAKRILMLQTQTLQIKEQFYRHLLAGFPGRPNSHPKGSTIASRRASNLAFRPSMKGNLQKLSLDLSNISSSFLHGLAATSTTATADSHVPSPNTPFGPNMQPYISCTDGSKIPDTILATPLFTTTSRQITDNMKQTSAPAWSTAAIQ